MRPLIILIALALTALTSTAATADSWRYGRSYDTHRGHYSSNRHSYPGWNQHYRSFNRHYGDHYSRFDSPRRSNYVSVSFGNYPAWSRHGYANRYSHRRSHRHYDSHDAASFVGGLVIGGLLSSSIQRDYRDSYSPPVVRTRVITQPTVIRTTQVVNSPRIISTPDRTLLTSSSRTRLLRDLQGQCFEITYAVDGTEQRAQLADEECAF